MNPQFDIALNNCHYYYAELVYTSNANLTEGYSPGTYEHCELKLIYISNYFKKITHSIGNN